MRYTIIIALCLISVIGHAQTKDDFGGLTTVPCPANPHALHFTTGSQSGTTQTLTITGPSAGQTWQANTAYSYGQTILDSAHHWQRIVIAGTSGGSQPTFNDGAGMYTADNSVEWGDWGPEIAVDEPMKISGTGTAMDWAFANNVTANASLVSAVNLSTGLVTLTATNSATVTGPVSGTIVYGGYYSTNLKTQWGTGPQLCTPEGNWQWFIQIADPCANNCTLSINFATKYGTVCAGVASEEALWKSWNFNAVGEALTGVYDPSGTSCPANSRLPSIYDAGGVGSLYPASNYGGYMTQAVKNVLFMLGTGYTSNAGSHNGDLHNLLEMYDPRFPSFVSTFVQNINNFYKIVYHSPWIAVRNADDNDYISFTNQGPDFHTFSIFNSSSPTNETDTGYEVLVSTPISSGAATVGYGNGEGAPIIYSDPINYAKAPMSSPPTSCGLVTDQTQAPCSLETLLALKYGTVGAVNTAYGSTYTTLLSSGTQYGYSSPISSWYANGGGKTTICTGAGNSASCTGTLNHGTNGVSVYSVALYYTPSGGSPVFVGFDCPNAANSNCTASAGVGKLFTPGRWKASTAVRAGLIVNDSNGSMEQLQTTGNPACTTNSSEPSWTTTIGNTTTDSGCTWKLLGPGLTTIGGASSSTITYATGAVSLTATGNIPNGAVWSAAYTTDGFGLGTGFLDEAGQNAWAANSPVCVTAPPAYQTGHVYTITDTIADAGTGTWQMANKSFTSSNSAFSGTAGTLTSDGSTTNAWMSLGKGVCQTGGDFNAPTINAALGLDLENFVGESAAQWMSVLVGQKRQLYPELMDFGVDNTGGYGTPPRGGALQASNLYLDGIYDSASTYSQNSSSGVSDYQAGLKYQFLTRYFKGPMVGEQFIISNESPQTGCVSCYDTQVHRAQGWYTTVLTMLQNLSFNGTQQNAGIVWFASHPVDGACPNNNWWGLMTCNDNAFDGHDDVTATVTCAGPQTTFQCGGESSASWNGSNAWATNSNVTQANALWFLGIPNTTSSSGTGGGWLP